MDFEVIDVDGMSHRTMVDDEDEPNEGSELNASMIHEDDDEFEEPYMGMEFETEDAARSFYNEYARRLGFSSKVGLTSRTKADGTAIYREFICAKEGLRRRQGETCEAMLRIELKAHEKWVITRLIKEHSHSILSPSRVHYLRPRRHFAGTAKAVAEACQRVEAVPSGVMFVSMDGNRTPVEKNRVFRSTTPTEFNRSVRNSPTLNYADRSSSRKRMLGKDTQNLLEYFKKMQAQNPGFFYAIQLDEDSRMSNVFWADARSRTAYSNFGDALALDTSYRVNQYRVPIASFTGVNHHGQTVLFGCALLVDESEASFRWLFKTLLTAMSDRHPSSITTEQDAAIHAAVANVFPESRHCISKWHVLREGQERLARVCHAHPNFQLEIYNCINLTETVEEFESSWNSILAKYDLRRNDWLQSIYSDRAQWAPVYFRDSFFAAMSPNQGYDGSFFEGYVNQQTTLPLFFRQYERALEDCFEREMEADFDTICTTPVLRTPSPMEKQAANLYTKKVFTKFQEELVETFVYTANRIEGDGANSTFRVAKFEDDNKAYIVSLNFPEMKATCSCKMFEYSGILCRHVLTVFTVTNVLTLPSHYILKRWTRNAKSGIALDESSSDTNGQESLTLRYNNLCREAIRYAEEGATAIETYNAAISALRDGGKKVAMVKKNVAKVPPPSSRTSGTSYDDKKVSLSSDATPLLWPHRDEVQKRFNLNDGGVPSQNVADLNFPRMAPVSLHRDDGTSESLIVLPCLKSMTWVMENKNSTPGNRVAVINLKLQDYSRTPCAESEAKFQLSKVSLEPMLKSMAYISEQLSTPANKVAVINLKLQDSETISGESEVKFQVSKDTLGAMLRSMAYIREQLSTPVESQTQTPAKKLRK